MLWTILCLVRAKETSLAVQTGLNVDWIGKSGDDYVIIGTIEGYVHCLSLITGEKMWSIDTGGSVLNGAGLGSTTYIPSIDGYLFAYVKDYGHRRVPLPIRDLCFFAPFRTETGDVFISSKSTDVFFVNGGGDVTHSFSSNSSIPAQGDLVSKYGDMTVVRINYIITEVVPGEGPNSVKFSEYDIYSKHASGPPNNLIRVRTGFNGQITIMVNGTIVVQTWIPGVPISVHGSDGPFPFIVHNQGGEPLPKHNVVFMSVLNNVFAIPVTPLTTPAKYDMLMRGAPALPGNAGPPPTDSAPLYGVRYVNRPLFLFESFRGGDTRRPAPNMVDVFEGMVLAPTTNFPYVWCGCILLGVFLFVELVEFLLARLIEAQNTGFRIVCDKDDPEKGMFNNAPCTLAWSNVVTEEVLKMLSSTPMNGVAKVNAFEKKNDGWLIAYQEIRRIDYKVRDAKLFLKNGLEALQMLFESGLVHGSLCSGSFFVDNLDMVAIGKLEESLHLTDDCDEKADDLCAVARVVSDNWPCETMDSLLRDLLEDMLNDDPEERPTIQEALAHPVFWSATHRLELLVRASDFINSDAARKYRSRLNEHRLSVVGPDWQRLVDESLVREASRGFQYSGESLADLMRLIRNKWGHKPKNCAQEITRSAETYFEYFHGLFPNLFLYVYYFYDLYKPS